MFCETSFGQRRALLKLMKPIGNRLPNQNLVFDVKNDLDKKESDKKYISHSITCFPTHQAVKVKHTSLDQIIYLNDRLYKRPNGYFTGK